LDGVTVTFTTTLGVFANWEQTITVTTTQGVAMTWLRSVPASGTVTSTLGADAASTAFTSTQILFTANLCRLDLTAWTEYAANPIFGQGVNGNTFRAYYPSVLYDPDRFGGHEDARYYKMWYGTRVGSDYGTGYAVSDDGVHWVTATVPVTSINGYHAHVLYDPDRFSGDLDEPYYKMWYWDVSNSINYATSDDGVDWTDHAGNPVITNALGWGSANAPTLPECSAAPRA
jgi:hypothetical protein